MGSIPERGRGILLIFNCGLYDRAEGYLNMRLRGPYVEDSEPALESCMKIQRSTGVNGRRRECIALSRVVPPSLRSLIGIGNSAFFCANRQSKEGELA